MVFSNSWERSFEGEGACGTRNVKAPESNATTTHAAAERHNACAHRAQPSTGGVDRNRAMIRFEKAYGTRSSGGCARAVAISFRSRSARFIEIGRAHV